MFIAILFFMLMSFFLSGSETALTAVNKMKLKTRAENNDSKAERLLKLVSKPDELITAILIGNNIANIMLPTLVTIIAIKYGYSVGLATGILTAVLIIFCEVLPKSIAASLSEKVAYAVYPVIRVLLIVCKPLTFLLSKFTRTIIKIFTKDQQHSISVSREELRAMVDIAAVEGTFRIDETRTLKGVLDFYSLDVHDVLKTPRMKIEGIPSESTFEEAREIVLYNKYSRYPVYKEDIDQIIGVFHSKLLLAWSLHPNKSLDDFTDNDPLFVFEFHSIEKVFKLMNRERKHMAIVLDEYGGTQGLITLEDIIEAMLGQEIEDESDEEDDIVQRIENRNATKHISGDLVDST
ncbi:CNNM domain-containing protein [Bacillus sp. S/N-304-OC-R1]|uniref:CNNM domain-containing protein n=1 Tax=Bacillus sp. S/N-304-OC-R1 TaxID=2758034 RepID=UPI001C8EEC67|nr:CNNM domain-containing protein [Bacillus sp. S/N-304-OC-R1]MBY0121712.1 DUF21 domain-containing protein [Bacillus sp. S/N-304-OC-R1]